MEITKIEISNYKSIKDFTGINFIPKLPTVIIGKNGSGKTNILEGINSIVQGVFLDYGFKDNKYIQYKIHISLSEDDFKRWFPNKEYCAEKCKLVVLNKAGTLKISEIQSEYILPLLKEKICDIRDISDKLQAEIENYTRELKKIECVGGDKSSFSCFNFLNDTEFTTYRRIINEAEQLQDEVDRFINEELKNFSGNKQTSFAFCYSHIFYNTYNFKFKLEYSEPKLSEFEKNFVTINREAIKSEISKINEKTEGICEKINCYINKICERTNILDFSKHFSEENNFYNFFVQIQQCINAKIVFLKSETTNVDSFGHRDDYNGSDLKTVDMVENLLQIIYSGKELEDFLNRVSQSREDKINYKIKDELFSEEDLRKVEDNLNLNLPEFERGMYEKISVNKNEKGQIKIFLHEKSGDKTDINFTSTGRRWYFKYYFAKSNLKRDTCDRAGSPFGRLLINQITV